MKKVMKLLIGGTILGGMGYLYLSEKGRDRRLRMADTAIDAREVLSLGNDILRMETPEGIGKGEHIGLITSLFKELGTLQTPEEIEATRFRLSILANVDEKWRPFSQIFNRGVWTAGDWALGEISVDGAPEVINRSDVERP